MGRMGGMSLNGEGEKEEDTAGTEETRSQTVHPPPLCWGPSATKETADGGLGSTALKSARPPTYYPHTSLSLSRKTEWQLRLGQQCTLWHSSSETDMGVSAHLVFAVCHSRGQ